MAYGHFSDITFVTGRKKARFLRPVRQWLRKSDELLAGGQLTTPREARASSTAPRTMRYQAKTVKRCDCT